ncbi:hypothetical protein NMY22_g1464 [Coprinellus aureogranulatus]|nr:hypothetical protein NMY22_g1464 [Coprinellus aureogranulatus]
MMHYGFLLSILTLCLTRALANTEIVNFEAVEARNFDIWFTREWPSLNVNQSTLRWNLTANPLDTPKESLNQGPCTRLYHWNPNETPEKCLKELWLLLDLDGEKWASYTKYTLRLSWPASYPVDAYLKIFDSSDIAPLPRPGPPRRLRRRQGPSQYLVRRKFARIQLVNIGVLNPTSELAKNAQHDPTMLPEPVPIIITLEPLLFGVLPQSLVPTVYAILGAVVVGIFIAKAVIRRLQDEVRHYSRTRSAEDRTQRRKLDRTGARVEDRRMESVKLTRHHPHISQWNVSPARVSTSWNIVVREMAYSIRGRTLGGMASEDLIMPVTALFSFVTSGGIQIPRHAGAALRVGATQLAAFHIESFSSLPSPLTMSATASAEPKKQGPSVSSKPTMVFDPDDRSTVKHTKAGVWDQYDDVSRSTRRKLFRLPGFFKVKEVTEAYKGYPHVTRMAYDIFTLEDCGIFFVAWIVLQFCLAFMPALTLWYTGQLLHIVEVAVETRSVDKDALLRVAALRIGVPFIQHALKDCIALLSAAIQRRIEVFYTSRAFRTASALDVPTFASQEVLNALRYMGRRGYSDTAWYMFTHVMEVFSSAIHVASQAVVLVNVFQDSPEAMFLVAISLAQVFVDQISSRARSLRKGTTGGKSRSIFLVLTCKGLRVMVSKESYRKDIVAGGLGETLYKEFKRSLLLLGDDNVRAFTTVAPKTRWMEKIGDYLRDPVEALGQVYTCLKVVNSPSTAPISIATLQLVNSSMANLTLKVSLLGRNIDYLYQQIGWIRSFYAVLDLQNKIQDGSIPFPENKQDMAMGISVEFRNVSFKYSEKDDLVLKHVSFKIEQGQLCVIVGENGSGKSTILSLMTRVYDVDDGEILINGKDIRTLKLADIRKAIAVLFQEYSIFPVNLARNIGYGDPERHTDMENIRQAARFGGAEEFIESLPYKYDTYVDRPVHDWAGGEPAEDSVFAGATLDFSKLNLNAQEKGLSGGQKQRIALSRTFMKALVSVESNVGLLLFDEPSASLDPKAEHDLFTRLRELRGNKSMVFSTHRFGKLTRHADLILYIHHGEILEAGNHVELMKKPEGEYAKFWNLQAQDFL